MIFSPQSKVWIYQSSRKFSNIETNAIQNQLNIFVSQWQAHGQALKAKAEVLYGFFIVITVDETVSNATGCSIDASVKVLKEIEQTYNLDLFNRFNVAYKIDDEVFVCSKEDFETLVAIKKIKPKTIVFNNMVQTLNDFETKWEIAFENSWHQHIFGHLMA
ncbi:MAG: ABC transporter ATPase [Sphingobacteriaceae bacterium]|nr:ABC transporter ATPase [Sphingobacteriaceae bacterium]